MSQTALVYIALGVMFVLPGAVALWAGISGNRSFFQSPSYKFLVDKLGLDWTRVIFVLVGLLFFGAVALVIIDPMNIIK